MKKNILPSAVKGSIQAPPSKSAAQRAIAAASMAPGLSELSGAGHSDDVLAAIGVCRNLGATVIEDGERLFVGGGISLPGKTLHCGESGLGIRMFAGIAASLAGQVVLTGQGSLTHRPMHPVGESLRALGVSCHTTDGKLPLYIKGPMPGGRSTLDGSLSSQILTGILMGSPGAMSDTFLEVKNLKSRPYIDLTIEIMEAFGIRLTNHNYKTFHIPHGQTYQNTNYKIEGDWSGAAFILVAGAIAGQVTMFGLRPDSKQADKAIIEALAKAGAGVRIGDEKIETWKQDLQAFSFDATHCPDLFPPLVCLASQCRGKTKISGRKRLMAKESDRSATLMDIFHKMGIQIETDGDDMIITGGEVRSAQLHSHNDHRIAMAAAISALCADGPVNISGAEAVNKSYPGFFDHLQIITTT